jgi:hypothetical protein
MTAVATRTTIAPSTHDEKRHVSVPQMLSDAGRQIASSAQALGYLAERYPLIVGTVATVGAGALLQRRRTSARRLSNGRAHGAAHVLQAVLAQLAASSDRASRSAHEVAQDVSHRAREVASSAVADIDVGDMTRRLHEGGHRVQEQLEAMARREPMWFGALALAIGAIASAALRRRS